MRIQITDHPGPDRNIECESCVLAFAESGKSSWAMRWGTDEAQVRAYAALFRHLVLVDKEMPGLLDAARSLAEKEGMKPVSEEGYETGGSNGGNGGPKP